MGEQITVSFLQLGAGYVIAAAEALAVVFLFVRLDQKDKAVMNRDIAISALQEKMVLKAEEKTEQVIIAIKDQTQSNFAQSQILAGLKELIEKIAWGKRK